jgi:hypothetical protein
MMPQHEIERFYWNAAGCYVDLLRARLGIPEPVQFKPRAKKSAPAPAPEHIALVERPAFIVCVYVAVIGVMAFSAWRTS